MQPLRLCAVSYLNTKPFLEGLTYSFAPHELHIQTMIPSDCASAFLENKVDIGLIPVGSLLDWEEVHLLDRFCIGASGKVDSVFLFANEPVSNINNVYLDHHSRSSNGLTKILFRHYWKKEIQYLSEPHYFHKIDGDYAGVIIGDRAIVMKDKYRYCYDLAYEWQQWTGLPFAFAVWVYNPLKINHSWINRLEDAFERGINCIPEVARKWAESFMMTPERAEYYLSECIDYYFDPEKQKAFHHYLRYLAEIEGKDCPRIHFREKVVL
jgi:chorismate dehydratase